ATKVLGDGIAVLPSEGVLCSPTDGRVDQVFETGHAITLVTEGGAELLLHIGIDTVALKGQHFEVQVAGGQTVKCGDELICFDMAGIRAAGYDVTTPMIVSNSDEFELTVLADGNVRAGQALLRLRRKAR
ncbi:MAG: PTS glucose transporter subunit IIA, partial [Clostridia bacterium]|nr:PTS glucose transporter subunit IIA [Clostridia bacterium]